MSNNITRYEKLKTKRPSIIRTSLVSLIYLVICSLLSFAFLVLGVAMLIDTSLDEWLAKLSGINMQDRGETYKMFRYFLSGIFFLLCILFFIIARLSRKVIRRTNYIVSLEEVMDGELNPEPNYVEI